MPAPPPVVLWLDPGGMTGFACLEFGRFWCDEYDWDKACDRLASICGHYRSALYIGWERFTILPDTHKKSPQPEAYEFPGVVKYLARAYGCALLQPAAPKQRQEATPQMLRKLGWWLPGKNDAQSAAQHLLAFLMRSNCVPPELAVQMSRPVR
jgi:hypothetical protein